MCYLLMMTCSKPGYLFLDFVTPQFNVHFPLLEPPAITYSLKYNFPIDPLHTSSKAT